MSRSACLVLLAHGSNDARWRRPFEHLHRQVVARAGDRVVELAYLQYCEPTLEQALASCRDRGAGEVLVVPLFMSGGGHVARDVPEVVRRAARSAGVDARVTGALAEEPEVADAMVAAIIRLGGA